MNAPRRRAWVPVALLLAATTFLYTWDLAHAPVYFGGDEAHFAVHAYAIAHTGHDLDGRALPLLFSLADPMGDPHNTAAAHRWYQPALLYLLALVLRIAPLGDAVVRAPTAIIGGFVDPLLLYLVLLRWRRSQPLALFGAAALALTPAHVIAARQALDYVLPIPFALAWLWCLVSSFDDPRSWLPAAAGAALGAGLFSYIGSWIFMPVCLLLTCAAYLRAGRKRAAVAAVVAFGVPAAVLIAWISAHPVMLTDTLGRYGMGAGKADNPSRSVSAIFVASTKLSEYWDYFDPGFLFLTGGTSMTTSTGRVGVLLLPVAVFLAAGLYDLLIRRPSAVGFVVVAAFALSPLPATIAGEGYMIQRELVIVAFAAGIAAAGADMLWRSAHTRGRIAVLLLLVAMPMQFAVFYRDYFTRYKLRSAFYYDPAAFGDVAAYLISTDSGSRVPHVYFQTDVDDAAAKWRFNVTRAGRLDLVARTSYFADLGEIESAPRGSLAVVYPSPRADALDRDRRWSRAQSVSDVDGRPAAVIFRKLL